MRSHVALAKAWTDEARAAALLARRRKAAARQYREDRKAQRAQLRQQRRDDLKWARTAPKPAVIQQGWNIVGGRSVTIQNTPRVPVKQPAPWNPDTRHAARARTKAHAEAATWLARFDHFGNPRETTDAAADARGRPAHGASRHHRD